MKFMLLTIGFISSFMINTNAQNVNSIEASDYYSSIVDKTNKLILVEEDNLLKSFKTYVPQEMRTNLISFGDYVKKLNRELEIVKPFNEDLTLLKAAKSLVDGYVSVVPLYEEKVNIESLPDSLYTIDKQEKSKSIMQEIDSILNPLNDTYIKETDAFAKRYNFPLTKSTIKEE